MAIARGIPGDEIAGVVIPASPQVDPNRKEKTIRVSFKQGLWIAIALAIILFTITATVVYVGFLVDLYSEEHLSLYLAGGRDADGNLLRNSTLIHLNRNPLIASCEQPAPAPVPVMAAAAAFLDDRTRLCGGLQAEAGAGAGGGEARPTERCYSYANRTWGAERPLIEKRAFSASVRLPDYGWWVAGGENDRDGLLDTTEVQPTSGSDFQIAFNLPLRVSRHCMVRINASAVMLLGGRTQFAEFSREVHTFNWDSNYRHRWQANLGLIRARHSHACFVLHHRVYVAGGRVEGGNRYGTDGVEVYDVQRETWAVHKALPGPAFGASYFSWHGVPTLLGGSPTRNWVQFKDARWQRHDQMLPFETYYSVAVVEKVSQFCPV